MVKGLSASPTGNRWEIPAVQTNCWYLTSSFKVFQNTAAKNTRREEEDVFRMLREDVVVFVYEGISVLLCVPQAAGPDWAKSQNACVFMGAVGGGRGRLFLLSVSGMFTPQIGLKSSNTHTHTHRPPHILAPTTAHIPHFIRGAAHTSIRAQPCRDNCILSVIVIFLLGCNHPGLIEITIPPAQE